MTKYIELEAAINALVNELHEENCMSACWERAVLRLRSIPAADVAPVRHGRWEKTDEQPYFRKHFHTVVCSVCHRAGRQAWNYCPNCGAKMNLEGE